MTTQTPWPARLTQAIAGQIRKHRTACGMSAEQLSARCTDLGVSIPRNTIADLENGRRASLGVAELLALAAALEVPPALLLFGVGLEETAEILPGYDVPAFRGLQWFSGESAFPHPGRADVLTSWVPVTGPAAPLTAYRVNDVAAKEEMGALEQASRWRAAAAGAPTDVQRDACEAAAAAHLEAAGKAADAGKRIRAWAAEEGYLPPPVIGTHEVLTGSRTGPAGKLPGS